MCVVYNRSLEATRVQTVQMLMMIDVSTLATSIPGGAVDKVRVDTEVSQPEQEWLVRIHLHRRGDATMIVCCTSELVLL